MTKWSVWTFLAMVAMEVVWIFFILHLMTPYFSKIAEKTEEKKNTIQEIQQWVR